MRPGKSPTRAQKILLVYYRLDPKNWLVQKNDSDKIVVVHKHTGTKRTLPKQESVK